MKASRQVLFEVLILPIFFAVGCTGGDNTKIVEAPPPPPPTKAEKAVPAGKPAGYGTQSAYQKAMERAASR